MHIGFITGSYRPDQDGVADYLANLRSHLAQRGTASTVLTTYDSAQAATDATVQGALSKWQPPQLIPLVRRILQTPADLLHIQHAAGSYRFERSIFLLPPLLRLAGDRRPLVTTAHEYGWWEWQPDWFPAAWLERLKEWGQKRVWWDREDGFLLTGSDAIITTNENITSIMRARLPTLHYRMTTIPIAANLTVVSTEVAAARQRLRQDFSWPQTAQVIVFFGFLHPIKGLDPLVQGFWKIADCYPHAQLLLMGGVETLALRGEAAKQYWQKIQQQIHALHLSDRVRCTGYIDAERASRYLSGADIGILPFNPGISLKSGSLLTMLAHRLPMIATCTSETDRVLIDQHLVAPIEPRSSEAIATAITALLANPDERQRLATAGHSFVQAFTWDAITDQHQAIYQQLSNSSASNAPALESTPFSG